MKTYKDINNNLWAYESDGSQDYLIPDNFILITESEANVIRSDKEVQYAAEYLAANSVIDPTKSELLAELQALKSKIDALG